jgi:hypothetical protein
MRGGTMTVDRMLWNRRPFMLHRRARIITPAATQEALIVDIRMHRRISRPVMTLAVLSGLIGVLASSPASAQGTPAQQAACQGDAMRLCGAYIPDVGRVRSCMLGQTRNLSPACRAQFSGGGKKKYRKHHRRS